MKNLTDILGEITSKTITLSDKLDKQFLFEEDDFGGDDTGGGDDGGFGDDAGGGDDPFGDDAGGGDPFGDDAGGGGGPGGGGSGDSEGEEGEEDDGKSEEDKKKEELDLDGHEDDPDFTFGKKNKDDVTLPDEPAAGTMFDLDEVMQATAALVSTLSEDQLVEYKQVKKCVELIFNGKILKPEDLDFKNVQNAIFLVENICKKLDIKTSAYLIRKLKEPLILKRDEIKQDIADQKNDLNTSRDAVIKLDTIDVSEK